MPEETKRNYDAEVQELLRIYAKHKALTISPEQVKMGSEQGRETSLLWISSEGDEIGNKHANA